MPSGQRPNRPARSPERPSFHPGSLGQQILARAQAGREVIQDFCPLAESLEWQLGQEYLRSRGNKAFLSDASPVPFVVNNDGTLSRHAAQVFFASLRAAEGTLERDLFVLELGVGVGLFARYFLDHFRDLCWGHKKDYYDRLCYVAADKSERMLRDVLRHGVLAHHPGRYRLRLVDALEPQKDLPRDLMFHEQPGVPFRAVFLNYLLDCLPAAVLEIEDRQVKQLCVRTCLARQVRLAEHSDLTVAALRERAQSKDPRAQQELLEVYGLFASEYDYRPVDPLALPHGPFAVEYGRQGSGRVLHNYGAIQCLDRLLDLVPAPGFILINDYGPTQATRDDEFEHQRFSLATFVGVNFPLLKAYYGAADLAQWVEPPGESRSVHARLLSRQPAPETLAAFHEHFSAATADALQQPLVQARACAKAGRFELAAAHYHEALARQPHNWVVLNEVATFLTFQLRDPKAGADMARAALAFNPTCSSELWNTLGDALFEWGRTAEARAAYQKALAVNESDVRARYNLVWAHQRAGDGPAALQMIAETLALDRTGTYRERLLHKQQEVLAQLTARHQQEYLLWVNLVSKYHRPDDPGGPEPPAPVR